MKQYRLKDYQLLKALGDKTKYKAQVDRDMLEEWAVNWDELTLLTLGLNSDTRLVLPPLQTKSKDLAKEALKTAKTYLHDGIEELFIPVHKGNHWVLFHLTKNTADNWDLQIIDSLILKKNQAGIRKHFSRDRHLISHNLGIKIDSWEYPKPTILQATRHGCGIVVLLNLILRAKKENPTEIDRTAKDYPKWTSGEKWLCGILFVVLPFAGLAYLIYKINEVKKERIQWEKKKALGKDAPIKVQYHSSKSHKLSKEFEMSLRMQTLTYLQEHEAELLASLNTDKYPFLTEGLINTINQTFQMSDHKEVALTYQTVAKTLGKKHGKSAEKTKKPDFSESADSSAHNSSYKRTAASVEVEHDSEADISLG